MAKNTTRKGLALAAAGSLAFAGLTGAPAQAAGLLVDGYVTLKPTTGTEYYVLTGTNKEFSLSANFANAAEDAGEYLKFLVVNADEDIVVDDVKSSNYAPTSKATGSFQAVHEGGEGTLDRVTITFDAATNFKVGDVISISGVADANDGAAGQEIDDAGNAYEVVSVNDARTVVAFDVPAASYADAATDVDTAADDSVTLTLVTPAYTAATDSFVFNTKSDSNNADKVLVLKTGAITTKRVATVTAWVDSNDNDKIDDTEYVSPTRTVTWLTAADVEVVTTITYPTAGDASVSADITLTPNLNGNQLAAGDVKVGFTRPGSTATVYANATQAAVARTWSAEQSLVTGNWVGMPHIFQVASSNTATDTFTLSTSADLGAGDVVSTATDGTDLASAAVTTGGTTTFVTGTDLTAAASEGYAQVESRKISAVVGTAGVSALYTTVGKHKLSVGDVVTVSGATGNTTVNLTKATVASVPSETTFTLADAGITAAAVTATGAKATYVSFIEAVPGTYSAKGQVAGVVRGNTSTNVTVANTSHDTELATTATANVQGVSNDDATSTNPYTTAYVRKGQTEVELTATIVDEDDVAVSAGRTVKVSLENLQSAGTPAKSGTFKINGTTYVSAVYLKTDANGKVTFTVSDDDGAVTTKARVLVEPENLTGAQAADIELVWSDVAYSIFDLNDNAAAAETGHNSVVSGGSYTYSLAVLDQWKEAPAAGSHRVKYATTGNTVATNYVTLTSGKGSYTVTDNSVGAGTSIQTVFTLEKLGTDGVTWTAQDILNDGNTAGGSNSLTYTTSVVSSTATFAVLLDSDGSTAYGAGAAADLSNTANTVELAPQDRRVANLVQPAYTASNRVTGRVANATTNAPRAGAEVTITGPASILFSEGAVDALGSLTVKTDASGEFGIDLYSTTVQTDTVITVTSGAASKTVKVSFTGQGASFGTAWAITAPDTAMPGSTFQYKAKLTDKYGNPVQVSTPGDVKVTYTGPGLIVGTLPDTTDKNGELTFSVLLGSNDKGTAVVTVSYDQNSDNDFLDAKDIVTAKTITVGMPAPAAPSADAKLNAGSFNGYVAVYAKGYKGATLSWKIAGVWFRTTIDADYVVFQRKTAAVGLDVNVELYINGVRPAAFTKTVTTR